ncbi:MAG: DNA repair exonuclease [Clostridia bacterium]|nr:DNA repair exonuclease [Clostridia bacterium]
MLKILHTGDLHLGSPYTGLGAREREERITAEARDFRRLCERANEEHVDLFLIAGDLFDTRTPSTATVNTVFDALEALNCPVVIAPGNHDPYLPGSPYDTDALPGNVYVFSTESLDRFSFPEIGNGVDVFGYAFRSDTLEASPLLTAPDNACLGDGLSILLCHGDLDAPLSKYAPIRSADIARCGADYVALGHVHNVGDGVQIFGDSATAYCGFAFGRSFDECGYGSFRLLTFDETAVTTHPLKASARIRCTDRRFASEEVDVSRCTSDEEVLSRLRAFTDRLGYGQETTLRVTLTGEVSPQYRPSEALLTAQFCTEDSPVLVECTDRTLPIYDTDYLESDPTIRGEVYRSLKAQMLSDSEETRTTAAEAFRIALAALDGRPIL